MIDVVKLYTVKMLRRAVTVVRRGLRDGCAVGEKVKALAVRLMHPRDDVKLVGTIKVWHVDRKGLRSFVGQASNLVTNAGLAAIVDALQASSSFINKFHYVGVGTSSAASAGSNTALVAELSSGSYARMNGSQGEGSQTYIYQVGQSSWQNNTGASRTVKEYGNFTSTTGGTMLSRFSTGDGGISDKTLSPSEWLLITWTYSFADA